MKTTFAGSFLRSTTTGALLLIGTLASLMFAPSASAFLLGSNGEITIFNDANLNPEGKSDVGRYFFVDFNGSVNSQALSGLSSIAVFQVNLFDALGNVQLGGTLYAGVDAYGNPLPNANLFQNYRVSVMGFAIDPNAAPGATSSGVFNTVHYGSINANGGIDTELCFKGGGGPNCNGGGDGGVSLGDNGQFTINFRLSNPQSSFTLSDFGVRYQSIDSSHYARQGSSGTGVGTPVPEPFTILGTSAALGFSALFKREQLKRQKKVAAKA